MGYRNRKQQLARSEHLSGQHRAVPAQRPLPGAPFCRVKFALLSLLLIIHLAGNSLHVFGFAKGMLLAFSRERDILGKYKSKIFFFTCCKISLYVCLQRQHIRQRAEFKCLKQGLSQLILKGFVHIPNYNFTISPPKVVISLSKLLLKSPF